jgi:hypothetical protein
MDFMQLHIYIPARMNETDWCSDSGLVLYSGGVRFESRLGQLTKVFNSFSSVLPTRCCGIISGHWRFHPDPLQFVVHPSSYHLTLRIKWTTKISITVHDVLTYLLTYLRSWALPDEPPIVQSLKNFPAFYGTRTFNTVFTRALHWSLSWVISIQSTPSHPVCLKSILIF